MKELETHIILAEKVGLLDMAVQVRLLERSDELGRMLRSLIRSLQSKE